jgi:hypothetical protein
VVSSLLQTRLRSSGLRDLFVGVARANGVDDALAHACDDRLVGRPAHEPVEVGPDRDLGLDFQLDAVLGHAVDRLASGTGVGTRNDLGIDAGLHGLEDVAAGQVDRRGPLVRQRDVGAVGGDQGADHVRDVAAGQVMGLQVRS